MVGKISELTDGAPAQGSDLFEITRDPTGTPLSRSVDVDDLATYLQSATQTLTNKTLDANGTGNSISNIETADLAASAKTGSDTAVVTGTAGTDGDLSQWNADGDLVDGPTPPSGTIVGTTDTQTLTNKTLTTPVIAQVNDANGNEALTLAATASAVNYLEAVNAATGNDVSLDAKGGDTNIGIALTPKGTGNIALGNFALDADQSVGASQDNFVLTYDDATGLISLEAASGGGSPGGSDGQVQYNNSSSFGGANVWVEDANTLALRNGATAQVQHIYHSFTDASNYSRATFDWNTNVLNIKTEAAGTGSVDRIDFYPNDTLVLQLDDNLATFRTAVRPNVGTTLDLGEAAREWRHAYIGGFLTTTFRTELTIATGAVTAIATFHTVDTEGDAGTDDLDTVNGGEDGRWLVLQPADSARTVVAKDGTGNLQLSGDFSMDNAQDTLTLMYVGALSAWVEISRSDNGA